MKNFLARVAYWTSLGFDTSEFPIAGGIQAERDRRLKKRIGSKEFHKFENMYGTDAKAATDPAFLVSVSLVLVPFLALFFLAVRLVP